MRKSLLLILGCMTYLMIGAQNNISGKVFSDLDSEPLIGVNVLIKGSNLGTITDVDGMFTLKNVPQNGVLEFSYVGYQTKSLQISGQEFVNVTLSVSNVLNEVVVTSFGISKDKKVLGYGSQNIKGDELRNSSQQNVVNALQGRIAGVTINSAGGAPGAGANINIRGMNSISGSNNNQPLFVVDGIIISNATNAGHVLPSAGTNAVNSAEQFMNTNRAADINPADIENINILKGAAATALYGQRAANGAVIITTKKGKSGTPSIEYSGIFGVENVNKVPEQQDFYSHGIGGIARTGSIPVFQQFGPPALATDPVYENFKDFFRQGSSANHALSISGGNEKANYYTSLSYFDQTGIVYNSDFNRITGKVAINSQLTNKFSVGGQLNYAKSNGSSPASGDKSIFSSLSYWSPSIDVNDYLKEDGTQKNVTAGTVDNPRYMAEVSPLLTDVNRIFGDINFGYKFNSWLQAKYQITTDYYNDKRNRVVPADLDLGSQVKGFITEESINATEINSNLFLTAEKKLSDNLNGVLTVGNTITDISSEGIYARGEGFVVPGFYNIGNTSNFSAGKTNSLRRLIGLLFDARLEYKNFLYLTVTGRNDWSSTLPSQNRSFFYPSVSLAYILTNSILEDNNVLDFAKLRVSFAKVGKDADPYQIGSYFAPTPGFPFGSLGGFRRDVEIGNYNLLPEITSETEVGLEANLWNNRVYLETNYFIRDSKNQIIDVPVSNVTGFSRFTTNAGLVTNKGIELLLGVTPVRGDITWNVDLNYSRIRNKVKSLPESSNSITYYDQGRSALRLVEGGSIGDLYGYEWKKNENGDVIIGANGLPTLDQSSYVLIGNALPDWTMGINNGLSYKGLALNVLLEWRIGGDMVDLSEINSIRNGIVKFTEDRNKVVVWKGVTEDGSPNTKQVVFDESTYRAFGINAHHSFIIQDASWFRVRNIGLEYTLPKSILGKTFKSLKIGLSSNNFYLNTPFRGYDPEALAFGSGTNLIGFTGRNTPNTRSYNLRVNVGF
ncbi:MAG: SusC/RagA family TonB-linked outer membrane protein [Lewinellaceae bacterium]|nr:SusC/RagA family TonB-linked outer membrane protein [Lewinellaceae bacterium]